MQGYAIRRLSLWFVVLWVSLWGMCSTAMAQTTGKLLVTVTEPDGVTPFEGAEASLLGDSMIGGPVVRFTDAKGEVLFTDLPPGRYELAVTGPGYATERFGDVTIRANQLVRVPVQLKEGAVEEVVVEYTSLLDGIPAGRSYQSANNVVAGVQPGRSGNASVATTTSPVSVAPPRPRIGPTEAPGCDLEERVQWWVSPDDSNSMSAPALLRAFPGQNPRVAASLAWRRWEFFNYAQWDYPPAPDGRLGIEADLVRTGDDYTFQVAVTAPRVKRSDRDPMTLTFVLDTSGSMSGRPIELTRQVLRDISAQLRSGDIVNVVTWSVDQSESLSGHRVSGPRDPTLERVIRRLNAGGGTNLSAGLAAGYRLARAHADARRIDRVVLVSDGHANVGQVDEELIGAAAGAEDAEGIYMIGVGVGNSYNDHLMERVTDLGRGASVYIHDHRSSALTFSQRFLEMVSVAARDVKIQYDLPPGVKIELGSFSGEEIATDEAAIRPQHIAPNDAMVLHQRLEACEELDVDAIIGVNVTYRDAITFEPRTASRQWRVGELLRAASPRIHKGVAMTAMLDALIEPKEELRAAAREAWLTAREVNPRDADLRWMGEALGMEDRER